MYSMYDNSNRSSCAKRKIKKSYDDGKKGGRNLFARLNSSSRALVTFCIFIRRVEKLKFLFEQGRPSATRGFSPVRFEPSSPAPSFGRLDRG